jgi:predicted phage terminase large subunit-like protein
MSSALARQPHPDDWKPNAGPQTRFLSLTCFEALYGGAAGGGKSDALLVDAIRYVGRGYGAAYQGLLLRRTFPELEGNLVRRSQQLYRMLGGWYNETKKLWTFPNGERVMFGSVEHEKDVHRYQGSEFQFVGFDELTSFEESQYLYLISRLRSAKGVPCRLRAATNPGNTGHEWVMGRWSAWLDPASTVVADPGDVLHFVKQRDGEHVVPKGTVGALGRTFVPAKIDDNPKLAENDPDYVRRLDELDPVTREQLRNGNWLIKPAKGLYFKRAWIQEIFDAPPVDVMARVRYWDLAAGGDYASGTLYSKLRDGRYCVENISRIRGTPGEVRAFVKSVAATDGEPVTIYIEQDPGQAGKDQIHTYVVDMPDRRVLGRAKRVDKITAFGPFSAQCQAGNVVFVRGAWNVLAFEEFEAFPEGAHDDQCDSTSGAHSLVVGALAVAKPRMGTAVVRQIYG